MNSVISPNISFKTEHIKSKFSCGHQTATARGEQKFRVPRLKPVPGMDPLSSDLDPVQLGPGLGPKKMDPVASCSNSGKKFVGPGTWWVPSLTGSDTRYLVGAGIGPDTRYFELVFFHILI